MDFATKAQEMMILKKRFKNDENGYHYEVEAYIQNNDTLDHLGESILIINEIDENSDSPDAQLIRSGVWNKKECCTLSLKSDKYIVHLARVNPSEKVNLIAGWITEKGEIIIKGKI
jgi:hypothetical protein